MKLTKKEKKWLKQLIERELDEAYPFNNDDLDKELDEYRTMCRTLLKKL